MAVLVTGATGFIGEKLCETLVEESEEVVALCRAKPERNRLQHPNIRIAIGDVMSLGSILDAIEGCNCCIHLAGMADQWARRSFDFYDVNAGGTRNVLDAAISNEIDRFVFVSTAGVYGPSAGDEQIVESSPIPLRQRTHYERSKRQAEKMVFEAVEQYELNACIVCPTRVFGPGKLTAANSVTRIMQQFLKGSWWGLPGDGSAVGNYVFVDDVVKGLLRAMELGTAGSRYILAGENLSYRQLFELIADHTSVKRKLRQVPYSAAMTFALFQQFLATVFGVKPKLTPAFAHKYFLNYRINDRQTRDELNLKPIPAETAIEVTMQWLAEFES